MNEQQLTKGLDEMFCPSCGAIIKRQAVICIKCGVPVRNLSIAGRDKITAVLLAVFFGFWTWCYTYRKDAWKFWLNLGLTILTLGLWGIVAWIWAMIDTGRRTAEFYDSYFSTQDYTPVQQAQLSFLSFDSNQPNAIRRNQLLTRLAQINRDIKNNLQPGVWNATICPLIVGILFGIIVMFVVTAIGAALFSSNASGPPQWWMGAVMTPTWLLSTVLFVILLRKRELKRHTLKLDEFQKQISIIVKQISSEFPDFIQQYGGENALREFGL